MPAPDPWGITIENRGQGCRVFADMFMLSGRTQRLSRARRIVANLRRNGWTCQGCGGPVPEFRRADARYCRESCRKRQARERPKGSRLFPTKRNRVLFSAQK